MPKTITDVDSFDDPISTPQDLDKATATTGGADRPIEDPIQRFANRTRYLYNRIQDILTSLTLSPEQVLGRRSTGTTEGKSARDFSFDLLGLSTAIAWLDAQHTKGADLAAASVVNIGAATGYRVHVTGSGQTIQSFGTKGAAAVRFVRFTGANTLEHNAAIILPGSANITTSNGDELIAVSDGSGVWYVVHYQHAETGPWSGGAGVLGIAEQEGVALYDDYDSGLTQIAWRPALGQITNEGVTAVGELVAPKYGAVTFEAKEIPLVHRIGATSDASVQDIGVLEGALDGSDYDTGTVESGKQVWVRYIGVSSFVADPEGFSALDPVYPGNDSLPSLTPGNSVRRIGYVLSIDDYDITYWHNGLAGSSVGFGSLEVSATDDGDQADYAPSSAVGWAACHRAVLSPTSAILNIKSLSADGLTVFRKTLFNGGSKPILIENNQTTGTSAGTRVFAVGPTAVGARAIAFMPGESLVVERVQLLEGGAGGWAITSVTRSDGTVRPAVANAWSGETDVVQVDANATGIGAPLFVASDSNREEADDSAAEMPVRELALEAGTGQRMVLRRGWYYGSGFSFSPGGTLYFGYAGAGTAITQADDEGDFPQPLGYAETANLIWFEPGQLVERRSPSEGPLVKTSDQTFNAATPALVTGLSPNIPSSGSYIVTWDLVVSFNDVTDVNTGLSFRIADSGVTSALSLRLEAAWSELGAGSAALVVEAPDSDIAILADGLTQNTLYAVRVVAVLTATLDHDVQLEAGNLDDDSGNVVTIHSMSACSVVKASETGA